MKNHNDLVLSHRSFPYARGFAPNGSLTSQLHWAVVWRVLGYARRVSPKPSLEQIDEANPPFQRDNRTKGGK